MGKMQPHLLAILDYTHLHGVTHDLMITDRQCKIDS